MTYLIALLIALNVFTVQPVKLSPTPAAAADVGDYCTRHACTLVCVHIANQTYSPVGNGAWIGWTWMHGAASDDNDTAAWLRVHPGDFPFEATIRRYRCAIPDVLL